MTNSLKEYDHFILNEMLTHPVIFTHPKAVHLGIFGSDCEGIIQEILKHPSIQSITYISPNPCQINDDRIQLCQSEPESWLMKAHPDTFDIIIARDKPNKLVPNHYQQYLTALRKDGIFIQQSNSLFDLQHLKLHYDAMHKAGFHDIQILHFPQPSFPSGLLTALMGTKQKTFKRIREKDIYNKNFATRYYNFDTHKAALVLPEFLREEIIL